MELQNVKIEPYVILYWITFDVTARIGVEKYRNMFREYFF